MVALRADLPAVPARVGRLPRDNRGFPVPWFVQWFRGQPPVACDCGDEGAWADFRVMDGRKLGLAVRGRRCWVCGDRLGTHLAFVIGPMCAVNRVISEPPSHLDCAVFSATACPFLSKPRMRRNEKDLPADGREPAGIGLKRNPGVACVWVTRSYRPFRAEVGEAGVLFALGDPEQVLWFAEGRPATRAEVMSSIDSGYPALEDMAKQEGVASVRALHAQMDRALPLLPVSA